MLVLQRRLNEVLYAGYDLSDSDCENTYDVKLTVTRIVNSFDRPRVICEVDYRLEDGGTEKETVQFEPSRPKLEIGEMVVKLISIESLVYQKTMEKEPVINFGFEAEKDYKILRANAKLRPVAGISTKAGAGETK